MKELFSDGKRWAILLSAFISVGSTAMPPTKPIDKVTVYGVINEWVRNGKQPLGFALIAFPDYGIGTSSSETGEYSLTVPEGKARMTVQYLGKVAIDTLISVTKDMKLDFVMQNDNFKLKEVMVTAQANAAGKATSSKISRAAMDHLQATSLYDLMALLPGGTSVNQDLSFSQSITLRQVSPNSQASSLNALGTAIIRDGAPVSNNANLQSLNPTVAGSGTSLAGGASPNSGVDVRSVSTENIESVEVIRGIPSVEYGDLTSGAVILHTKAGREPLRVKAKANPNVYQGSIGTGFDLGHDAGALNVSGDYAYNVNNPIASYQTYQRVAAKVVYSNLFFNRNLRSNTSLDFLYSKDRRKRNPDDEIYERASKGSTSGITFNTNGRWNLNHGWLQNIRYVVSGTYTAKNSFDEQLYSSANAPYSMTLTDGAVLSNKPSQHLFDADGKEITHFGDADNQHYAVYLPSTYKGRYEIDSKEINVYAKLAASFFKNIGAVNNRLLIGADFQSDGNVGDGKTYDPSAPPYRNLSQKDATFRPRSYRDIPFVNQVGAFAEENLSWNFGNRELNIQAGIRYDHASVVKGAFSPRVNASFEVLPDVLFVRGGYGITAKMPTVFYLHPENAYFEYVNFNNLADEKIPEDERLFITTTKVYDAENKDLKIARNHKAEVGFDLHLGKASLSVTAFREKLKDGYMLGQNFDTFKPFTYNEYKLDSKTNKLTLDGAYPVLSDYYTPTNNLFIDTKGVEFELNLGRIDAIRTAFQLNGAWMRTKSYNNAYHFYDNSGNGPDARKDIAIYAPHLSDSYSQQFSTTLRATHNIPSIGFVVTLTAQAIWQESNWKTFGNDSIPLGYLSLKDASANFFQPGQYTTTDALKEAGYDYLLENVSHASAIKESYSPYFCFNINVTKEISDYLRVSFFANNMFRSYPRRESKRSPGTYYTLNNRFFFGVELSLTF